MTDNQIFKNRQFDAPPIKRVSKTVNFDEELEFCAEIGEYQVAKTSSPFSIKSNVTTKESAKILQIITWFNHINWWDFFAWKFLPIGSMIFITVAVIGALPKAFDLLAKPIADLMLLCKRTVKYILQIWLFLQVSSFLGFFS